jgi:hypothetical protein
VNPGFRLPPPLLKGAANQEMRKHRYEQRS